MRRASSLVIYSLMLAIVAPCSNASEDLFALDLTELSKLKVTIGSAAQAERIIETPVVATRYTPNDMNRLGLRTLEDMLTFVPGVVVQDSAIGTKAVMIRGIVEAFNQKVLFLLDGVPYWQPAHGDFPLLALPANHIEAVEVIRGPGAVIYGTNASGGVINVITKQSTNNTVSAGAGSNGYVEADSIIGLSHGDINVALGGHIQTEDGYEGNFNNRPVPPIYPTDTPTDSQLTKSERSKSVWAKLHTAHWNLGIHHTRQETNGLAAAASTINESTLKYQGTLIHFDHNQEFDFGSGNLYSDWTQFSLNIPTDNLLSFGNDGIQQFEDDGAKNTRARAGYKLNWKVVDNVRWLNGVEFEQRTTGNYQNTDTSNSVVTTSMMRNDTDETSLYSQLDMSWQSYRVVLGARHVKNEKAGEHTTPRLAFIKQLTENQSIKVLYSVGFNSPNFIQQHINIPPNIVKGDENLKAEKIRTTEVAYTLQTEQHFFVANAYRLITEDFIFRSVNDNAEVVFANTRSYERSGLELDYRHQTRTWDIYANASWIEQGNQTISDDGTALFAPRVTANTGFSIKWSMNIATGLSLRHIAKRDTADPLNLLNANASYSQSNWSASVTFENILGEEPLHPDVQNFANDKLVPNGSKATRIYGRFSYVF